MPPSVNPEYVNFVAAWLGILLGILAGAVQGLFSHDEAWLGGYGSWPRRMTRLGHVAFFGLGFINLAYALSVRFLGGATANVWVTWLLVFGAITMPPNLLSFRVSQGLSPSVSDSGGQRAGGRGDLRLHEVVIMKIGLIAMSGIRACDAELLRLGLTLPGFVERSKVIASLPSLGLLTLAGLTPADHSVEYLEIPELTKDDLRDDIRERFDLVAISSYSAQINEAYELADFCRARGVAVVMGGLHVTSLPTEAGAHCDAVVIGEGECSWPRVLEDASRGRLQATYGSPQDEYDLAEAPMPAFELLDLDTYNRLTVQTSRGCPYRCEFCASTILITGRYKQKPIDKVLAEIDRIVALWPHPFVELADDNTFVNKAYWRTLLPELSRRKIRWFTETDISVAEDPELLELLRAAGCAQVLVGLESPTRAPLDGLEARSN